jgi:hypothetical protein
VALAGDMVIFNAQGRNSAANPVMILTDPAQREQVSLKDYLPVLCTSADRLAALLGQGFGDWQAYRDRVLSEGGGS